MAKVFVGVGHGGADAGAVGYLTEKNVNLKMAKACRDYLLTHGVEVMISRETDKTDYLNDKINRCNQYGADLALDIHNNGGGGDGFEAYHTLNGGTGKVLAQNIEAEVKAIGQNSRGCKTRANTNGTDYYGFIRKTKMPAVICEGVFVDNAADASQADTDAECRAFGEAYARGILKTLGIADVPQQEIKADKAEKKETSSIPYRVRVTTDALRIRQGAGTGYRITGVIRDRGTYTIMEEQVAEDRTWGRLKSGAGWICLDYAKKL